jgi:hypothetical protein
MARLYHKKTDWQGASARAAAGDRSARGTVVGLGESDQLK